MAHFEVIFWQIINKQFIILWLQCECRHHCDISAQ